MGKKQPRHGMNLRDALKAARDLGCSIRRVNRTGELIIGHPSRPERVVINSRRKDAPRALSGFLMAVQGFEIEPSSRTPAANNPQERAQHASNKGHRGRSRPRKKR